MSTLLASLRVVVPAIVVVMPVGAVLGLFLARGTGLKRALVDGAVLVPLVLPPSVIGYGLLLLLGRNGFLGSFLDGLGVRLVFTSAGASVAAGVVALPLMAKGAEAAFLRVDKGLEEVSRANGLSRTKTFRHVTLPLALPGLGVAVTLAALRAVGEFGATLTFAGYSERTATAPLEVYFAMQRGDDGRALSISLVLVTLSVAATLLLRLWSRR